MSAKQGNNRNRVKATAIYSLLCAVCIIFGYVETFIPTGFIAPGVNGITLAAMNATRLRLYKYDWLDEHPGYINDRDKRANVPWDELIAQDKETLGPRKISSFLFPWK